MLYLLFTALLAIASAKGNNSPPGRQRITYCHRENADDPGQTMLNRPLPSWNGHSHHEFDCLGPCPCAPPDPCAGNLQPNVSCTYPMTAVVGTEVTFDCSATTDPEGSVLTFVFNADGGSGSVATNGIYHYTYSSTGTKAATVEVTDDCNNVVTADLPIQIFAVVQENCFDGLDNERLNGEPNGLIDCADSVCDGAETSYYDGPVGTENVGECRAGTLRCIDGNAVINVPQVLPSPDVCDGLDNDCDGSVDNDATRYSQWFLDNDGDGYGDVNSVVYSCFQPTGYTGIGGDCNDSDASVYPGAPQVCVEVSPGVTRDSDCDGQPDYNLQMDTSNCGSCGNTCASGEVCESGVCTPYTPGDCACDTTCPMGYHCNSGSGTWQGQCEANTCAAGVDQCVYNPLTHESAGCSGGEVCSFGCCEPRSNDCPVGSEGQSCGLGDSGTCKDGLCALSTTGSSGPYLCGLSPQFVYSNQRYSDPIETFVPCDISEGICPAAPTCDDGYQNGDETGVDCGGSCDPCPPPPHCSNGVQDGDETDVDCGGSCLACGTGQGCNVATDCPTQHLCAFNVCRPFHCFNQVQDGGETGVDCGGGGCPAC